MKLKSLLESIAYNAWQMPSLKQLKQEFHVEQVLKRNDFWDDETDFLQAVKAAKVEEITPEKNRRIRYRSNTSSYQSLLSLIKSYRSYPEFRNETTLKKLYTHFKENKELDYPLVVQFADGSRRVFAGNTRMDVAFQLGINPKVLIIQSDREY
jgi:hypothetical protein